MNKSKNNLTSLNSLLSGSKSGLKTALPTASTSRSSGSPQIKATSSGKAAPGANDALKSHSLNGKGVAGISFGRPSSKSTTSTSSSDSVLSSLLKSTERSGVSSLLSGSGLLSSLTGLGSLGSLGSLLSGLFGSSSKTLPALTSFTLPQPSSETFTVGTSTRTIVGSHLLTSGGSTTKATTSSSSGQQPGGIYAAPTAQTVSSLSVTSTSSAKIAQAVKTALLNSSSLNDVINEL